MNNNGSIYLKIRKQILSLSILSVVSICIIAFLGIGYMRGKILETSESLGNSAAADSKTALKGQMEESLLRLSKNKAALSDEKLLIIADYVNMIAENAEEIMANPDVYAPRNVSFLKRENEGIAIDQLRLPNSVTYESVEEEVKLIGNIHDTLKSIHNNSDYVRSAYIGTESGISISFDRDSGTKNEDYDPRERQWYTDAKAKGKMVWVILEDNSGRGLSVICAKPYFASNGETLGVAAIGMVLKSIEDVVIETKIGNTGYAFMVDEEGDMIFSDTMGVDADKNVVKTNLISDGIVPPQTAQRIISGESGIEQININNVDSFISYEPLKELPWILAVVMDVDEVIEPALKSEDRIMDMKFSAMNSVDKMLLFITLIFGAALIGIIIANIMLTKDLAQKLAQPIIELSKGAAVIGGGNLNYHIDIKTGDEIQLLADSVNQMTMDLRLYIENLAVMTTEKERADSELRVATDIQVDMLPKIFPPFSNRDDLHMASYILPAKQVGGDFYDFFFLDDEQKKIALVIADVSGKGVPAALFMVIAKVLIKNNKDLPCDEILGTVNNLLAADNNSSMFVTTFFSILNLETGEYDYSSAGHNPPVLYRKESGECLYLDVPRTPPLAIFPGKKYPCKSIVLQKGDTLLLYTDGVTEAFNNNSEMYGTQRLLQYFQRFIDEPVEEIVNDLYASIKDFAGSEPQSDDISMLCCRFFGKSPD